MKREEPIQPLSGFQDWHIKGRKTVCATCPFSHRQMGKTYFRKGFPTLMSKDDLKHQIVLWKHPGYSVVWRALLDPWQIVWTLHFPTSVQMFGSCLAVCSCRISQCSCCRAGAWKSQDLSDPYEETSWAGSQQGISEAGSLGVWCSCMISGTVWGDLGVRSSHNRKARPGFHFPGKLKRSLFHSGWNAGVGVLVQYICFPYICGVEFQALSISTIKDFKIGMQMVQVTNTFLHMKATEKNKITEKYAILCDLFLKLNFTVVNNAHFKLSWLGCLSAIGSLHRRITESQNGLVTFTHLL